MLKGVIFSLRDVVAHTGPYNATLMADLLRLLRFLKGRGITPVFVSNNPWTIRYPDNRTEPFKAWLERALGPVAYYVAADGDMPFKPKAAAMETVLTKQGWTKREAIFVGNSDNDMKTASNGGLMFLNALWHGTATPYGFTFDSPLDIARFVDCLCLGLSDWYWQANDGDLRVFALAPFSTMSSNYLQAHAYSANARATAKDGAGDATFWGRLLAARIYFSGLVDQIDHIAAYPGHAVDSTHTRIADALTIIAGSLKKSYLPDLLVRHTNARKSQNARNAGEAIDARNQLNTIHVNRAPHRNNQAKPYASPPTRTGKTILLVDDFCTQGNSFEAGRAFINSTGARVICLSWLKTINRDYQSISPALRINNPYAPIFVDRPLTTRSYGFRDGVVSQAAEGSLDTLYKRYFSWVWPTGI